MARKKKIREKDNELRWLTTYGDVVTLLLAFFVMLYAISQVDQQKFLLFVSGLQDPFGNEAVANGILSDGTGIVGGAFGEEAVGEREGFDGYGLLEGLPETSTDVPEEEYVTPDAEVEDGVLDSVEELEEVAEAVEDALIIAGLEDAVDFEFDTRGLVIAVATDDVVFASGSAVFDDRGREIIGTIAPSLVKFDNQILVEGHTDSVPLRRIGYDNWNLSADRALAVLKVLAGEYEIASERLAATGFGEFQPKASNETEDGKATNRRVELVVVADLIEPGNGSVLADGGDLDGGV